jgi:hypothetical protein
VQEREAEGREEMREEEKGEKGRRRWRRIERPERERWTKADKGKAQKMTTHDTQKVSGAERQTGKGEVHYNYANRFVYL